MSREPLSDEGYLLIGAEDKDVNEKRGFLCDERNVTAVGVCRWSPA